MDIWKYFRSDDKDEKAPGPEEKNKTYFNSGTLGKINEYLPKAFIIREASKKGERDITIFDIIAKHLQLDFIEKNVYRNSKGKFFIRTKYGFQSMISYNKGLQLRDSINVANEIKLEKGELEKKVGELEKKVEELYHQLNHQESSLLEELANQRNFREGALLEKIEKLEEKNKSLKADKTTYYQELIRYKQVFNTISKRLTKLQDESEKL